MVTLYRRISACSDVIAVIDGNMIHQKDLSFCNNREEKNKAIEDTISLYNEVKKHEQ